MLRWLVLGLLTCIFIGGTPLCAAACAWNAAFGTEAAGVPTCHRAAMGQHVPEMAELAMSETPTSSDAPGHRPSGGCCEDHPSLLTPAEHQRSALHLLYVVASWVPPELPQPTPCLLAVEVEYRSVGSGLASPFLRINAPLLV